MSGFWVDFKQPVVEFGERNFQGADEGSRAECAGQRVVWKQERMDGGSPLQEERGEGGRAGVDLRDRL